MKFYTAFNHPRPKKLCEETRAFAMESMKGKYGDDAMQNLWVSMNELDGFSELSAQEKYNRAILKIAEEAPIRICKNESVSGAATLGAAIWHAVPALYGEYPLCGSVSHLTVDFPTVLFSGVDFLEEKIDNRLKNNPSPSQTAQLSGMKNVIRALHIWHERYLQALKTEKPENYEILKHVPFAPAKNFKEAVQSLWFTFAFIRLCGNWPGIGRIDEMLGGFLQRDLEAGEITLDEAGEFLAGMFIKGCEWIQSDPPRQSGDAQHYQNIVLGGIDENGREVTNEVTYLVLDIVEELGISDFPITVRINENTPDRLLTRVAEVMRHGGGVIAVYNEPLILRSLTEAGYPEKEARKFANDGCWEVQVPGKTYFSYVPIDSLQILLNDTLRLDTDAPSVFDSYEDLYTEFRKNLKKQVEDICSRYKTLAEEDKPFGGGDEGVCSVVSLFEEGCIEKGKSYFHGGPVYNTVSPHIGGAPDTGNSLFALDRLVFREKKIAFSDLMQAVKNNWEDNEMLRQYVANKYTYYGNDCDESDRYTVQVLDDFAEIVSRQNTSEKIFFPAGVSTFGRQIEWAPKRCATPFGTKKGDILSGNASPTPDTDFEGATAVVCSYCKADLARQTCGAALDVKLFPTTVQGENGLSALKSLIRGFVRLGGFFMQIDVVDAEVLKQAQLHPERYKTLSVRVSGWNARFVTLDEKWQQMIIERNTHPL